MAPKKNAPNSDGPRTKGKDTSESASCNQRKHNARAAACQAAIDALLGHHEDHFRLPFLERSMHAIRLAERAQEQELLAYLLMRHLEFGRIRDRGRRGLIP